MKLMVPALALLCWLACGGSEKPAELATKPAPDKTGEPAPAPPPSGCPDDLAPAVVYSTEIGTYDAGRHSILVLHDRIIAEDKDPWASDWDDADAGFRRLSPAEARAVGMNTAPIETWLYAKSGPPSCAVVPTSPIVIHDGDALLYTRTAMEIDSKECDLGKEWYALALRQEARPECRIERAAKLDLSKAAVLALRPPDDFAAALRGDACTKPCEVRWRLRGAPSLDDSGFYELTITHLHPDPNAEDECMWDRQDWYGVLFRPAAGAPLQLIKEASGLYATAHDERGMRAAILSEDGRVTVHHIVGEGQSRSLRPGVSFEWYYPHEEETAWHSLGESCL